MLDVTGPPERTGKARGTDLLDGTVTLPLILARRSDPELARAELAGLDAADAERLCDRIAATGALDEVRERARAGIASAKGRLAGDAFSDEERNLLGLIADGVVERYSRAAAARKNGGPEGPPFVARSDSVSLGVVCWSGS